MFETQAGYSDSNNESDYREFEDSDYEDDILFDRNVDPSVETFSVNTNENTRTNDDSRELISQELQKYMQNEDGDSDCVDSSDTKSLNSDSDASNEDFNFPKHNPKTDGSNPKLALGQVFQNKKEFKEAVTTHEVIRGRTVEWIKDDSERARGRCKHRPSCEWVILASKMHRDTSFQIKTYNSEHTCFCWNVKNKNVTSSWIAKKYMDRIKSNRDWKTSKFRDEVSRALGVDVSLCQARKAKKKAISLIDGNINDQFSLLWNYINEIVRSNPGTSVYMELTPNETPNNPSKFQRLYICFAACKEGFKAGCRKIAGVDGCWLKDSMYGAQLLVAVGLDGNNNIFPIAYAIVEKECNDTWQWFLNYLMINIEIEEQYLWTFMSDKQKGLLEAFEKVLPNVSHRFCARHLHNNFKKAGFSGHTLKDAFWEAARATTVEAFNACMLKILELDKEAHEWLSTKSPSEWSRSHFSPLSKCDMLLNNVCEVFNSLILDARDKPIIKLLETIRHILMARIGTNRDKAEKWASGDICPTIKKKLHRNMKGASGYIPRKANLWNYEILGSTDNDICDVDLFNKICSCRKWELSGIPCKHAICAIWMKNDDIADYVHDCYKVETYMKSYTTIFPMNGQGLWPKSSNPKLLPPSYLKKKKGKKQRLRKKEVDEPGASRTRIKRKQKSVDCSKCGRPGHNKRTCSTDNVVEPEPTNYTSFLDSIMVEDTTIWTQGSATFRDKLPVRRGQ